MSEAVSLSRNFSRWGLFVGPLAALTALLIGSPEALQVDGELFPNAWIVFALLLLMAIWWVTEAVPIPVTSLLPIVILPLFGVRSISEVSAPYMHPVVVLLMGGFIFAKAIERWGLHERIALHVVSRAGNSPSAMIGGFMVAGAILSMWISNSATTIMMMPIALSVALVIEGNSQSDKNNRQFTFALLLGIAYACSIGGLGTPIGTPTNLIVMGYLNEQNGYDISFMQWMSFGLPAVILMLPCAWLVLTKWVFRVANQSPDATALAKQTVTDRLTILGRMTQAESRTLAVFLVIACLWMFRRPLNELSFEFEGMVFSPLGGLTDHIIAVIAVLLCFLVPAGNRDGEKQSLLSWKTAEQIPWGVLLLFGGGLSLAQAISSTGLSAYFGSTLAVFAVYPQIVIIVLIAVVVLALTEITSNVATASALMPVLGAIAIETGLPIELMAAPLALAASCAFMLPMATGPNAVVFATDQVRLSTMAKAGFRLNILALLVIALVSYFVAPLALN